MGKKRDRGGGGVGGIPFYRVGISTTTATFEIYIPTKSLTIVWRYSPKGALPGEISLAGESLATSEESSTSDLKSATLEGGIPSQKSRT